MVSVYAFYSDDMSSIHAEVYCFVYVKMLFGKNENKRKQMLEGWPLF